MRTKINVTIVVLASLLKLLYDRYGKLAYPLKRADFPDFDPQWGGPTNDKLRMATKLGENMIQGPETVLFDHDGRNT